MAGTDRRESIKLAIGAAILPFLAARAAPAHASTAPSLATINPPSSPMIYRRRLEKALRGGHECVIIQRDFEVRFTRLDHGGFRLSGQQCDVQVEAPPNLAQLAAIEEQRVEGGLFPIELDARGQIAGWPVATRDDQIAAALALVRERYARDGIEVGVLIEALHGASAELVATLPNDLFAPAEPVREEIREIDLPWGDHGEVLTRFEAERDPQSRLMRQAQRIVTTRYGGEERCNRESWSLVAA